MKKKKTKIVSHLSKFNTGAYHFALFYIILLYCIGRLLLGIYSYIGQQLSDGDGLQEQGNMEDRGVFICLFI